MPWSAVALAVGLLLFGLILVSFGALHVIGRVKGKDGAGVVLLVLGGMTFLPGFYQSRLAWYTLRGRPGYRWSDIPEM